MLNGEFHFARPTPLDSPGILARQFSGADLSEDQEMLADELAGLECYPEAHASEHSRNASLGSANGLVEFVATDWSAAQAAGFGLDRVAIGPAPGEQGFDAVASAILPEVLASAKAFSSGEDWHAAVVIRRVQCSIDFRAGKLQVSGHPLYGVSAEDAKVSIILEWLFAAVSARL